MERRLLLGSAALVPSLACCSALSNESPMLDLAVYNQTDEPYTIALWLFRANAEATRSEARVFSSELDVDPDGELERDAIAESRPYVLRYRLYEDNSTLTDQDHVHYYPDDAEDDGWISFDIRPPGVLVRR
ncbi:hypothetical protein [Halopiger goleimassiliensis]|uniref:hypothetical protein n=1 Tax=Halopiger goleimassiliensis TaxID=1293048 RepID=UPI000677CA2B|nr:hypothetical protein [Halopiger goleimassiliensis]